MNAPTLTALDPQVHELAQQLRVDSIRSTTAAGSGHPTSSMSAADLIAVLLARHLRYDVANPKNPNNDHLIFSKGHASPLLYSFYKAAGAIDDAELDAIERGACPSEAKLSQGVAPAIHQTAAGNGRRFSFVEA